MLKTILQKVPIYALKNKQNSKFHSFTPLKYEQEFHIGERRNTLETCMNRTKLLVHNNGLGGVRNWMQLQSLVHVP